MVIKKVLHYYSTHLPASNPIACGPVMENGLFAMRALWRD